MAFTPIEYTKDGRSETADSPSQQATYEWEGWSRVGSVSPVPTLRELVAQLKASIDAGLPPGPKGDPGVPGPKGDPGVAGSAATVTDASVASQVNSGTQTKAALRAALGSADPVVSMTYNTDGTVATSTEDGTTTVFTYNPDGTVATTQRGTGPVRVYSYTGGNLVGVA